ncbi:tripartite tricarboxylate transporter TctB family protein [Budviciaceae bacterium BWR-B9]|uniref:Tripartite tricarboxylate transporter TctB family protein n=1 Tax=Limnobaculum allomyrinae TaxID=2791986 RepID=A0ABS1IQ41_9GAMM|nr:MULTISPECIES: tripartite tricarboxylate transporter TctB family protein [Limnobaculum]MBK5143667.1 tripartite tricarboxylate transporter TctB family protein [Limnobaculum allomyrinae]MBV7692683.1 tripartite tricarboxylate transporter TctB family protein [Limnobaculum sp. M2-1]
MRKLNILVGLLSVLLGGVIMYLSRDMSMFDQYGVPGERFWPYGLAWLFIGLGVLQWIEVAVQRAKTAGVSVDLTSLPVRRAYVLAIVMVLYGVLLNYTGFIVASLLLSPVVMWMMGERRAWFLALISVVIVATIYVSFTLIFNSPLPVSEFLE